MNVPVIKVSADRQLQEIFRQAQAEKTPVSLYRRPVTGRICLDFSNWKDIEVFDVENLMVIVPPGILLKDLNAAAATRGLRFIPGDTPFLENLSVGEWAYRGCPNPLAWKYGAGKHFLLGSTYVLPNGDITPVGGKCIKNVSGYDFTRFFTGGYADLAVGVRYIIKLMPQPAYRHRFDVAVASPTDAVELVGRLQARSVPPAWLFWLDEETGDRLLGQRQPGHRILFGLDGNKAEVLDHVAAINNILAEGKILSAETPAAIPDLSSLESAAGGFWLLDEIKLPYPAVPAFADRFRQVLAEHGVGGGLCGQLADGKIHIYLDREHSPAIAAIVRALQAEAQARGGAAAGKYARLYGGAADGPLANLEAAVRRLLDPQMIFNRREADES